MDNERVELKALEKGPLMVKGPVKVITPEGKEMLMDKTAICRCSRSINQPFCDGSHAR